VAYSKILVGTDGSPTATQAVREAAEIAKSSKGELLILCVFEPPAPAELRRVAESAPEEIAWRITGTAAAEEVLAKAAKEAETVGVKATTRYEPGEPADMLIDIAEKEKVGLIIVGNKGMKGVKRFLSGSVPNKVSHHAPCDVLIIKTN
jgi:nucleotide-binding universal stress UspA family protein